MNSLSLLACICSLVDIRGYAGDLELFRKSFRVIFLRKKGLFFYYDNHSSAVNTADYGTAGISCTHTSDMTATILDCV